MNVYRASNLLKTASALSFAASLSSPLAFSSTQSVQARPATELAKKDATKAPDRNSLSKKPARKKPPAAHTKSALSEKTRPSKNKRNVEPTKAAVPSKPSSTSSHKSKPAAIPAVTAATEDHEGFGDELGGDLAEPPPSDAPVRRSQSTQRFNGPYALSVRDHLNEMVVVSSLIARGLDTVEGVNPNDAALIAAVPSHLPAYGMITSGFGIRRSPFNGRAVMHRGIDIAARSGSAVYAAADGVVQYAGWKGPLGRAVMINHGYGILTKYAHNSRLVVRSGDVVRRGDIIARVGSTGRSTGAHLHYEVRVNGQPTDPMRFMFDVPSFDNVTPGSLIASLRKAQVVEQAELAADAPLRESEIQDPPAGLAMGGESEVNDVPELRERHVKAYDRGAMLPVNASILGCFAFLASFVMLVMGRGSQDA